ncbi:MULTISPECIES: hypothetical protein [unclassified Micromonospora]|uniref:hypothetical protein n=1 Tax=unclassified Micromonospora TaxID=2617518 RepID=UPI00363B0330
MEHYISDSVLKVLGASSVSGPAYTGGKSGIDIKRSAFGANVLCRNHNSDLSSIDANAQLLFTVQRLFVAEISKEGFLPESEQIDISGDMLERWLLKSMIAHVVARIFTAGGSHLAPPDLEHAARLVFEEDPWPRNCGLWMHSRPDTVLNLSSPVGFEPIWMKRDRALGGGRMEIGGLDFWISMFSPASGDGGPFDGAIYRPSGIVYNFPSFKKVIGFHWRDGSANPSISYNVRVVGN